MCSKSLVLITKLLALHCVTQHAANNVPSHVPISGNTGTLTDGMLTVPSMFPVVSF